jgi:DNA-binding MarR family transcriptional regulator
MSKYNALKELISKWEEYEGVSKSANLNEFALWLHNHTEPVNVPEFGKTDDIKNPPIQAHIGQLMDRLTRYSDMYIKKALGDLGLNNVEELKFLGGTLHLNHPRKSDLVSHNMTEFTSGSEVIKRLIAKGFITEEDDAEDKRSKRLSITQKGIETLQQCGPRMQKVSKLIYHNISNPEMAFMYSILKRIDDNQKLVWPAYKDSSLDELAELLSPEK